LRYSLWQRHASFLSVCCLCSQEGSTCDDSISSASSSWQRQNPYDDTRNLILLAIQTSDNRDDCVKAVAECVRGRLFSNTSLLEHLEAALLALQERRLELFFSLLQSLPLLPVGHLPWTSEWELEQLMQEPVRCVIRCWLRLWSIPSSCFDNACTDAPTTGSRRRWTQPWRGRLILTM
jgi:hypothetical protein